MCHRHNELDMARTLTAHFLLGNLHTASVADDTLISDALVFSAGTLIVLGRTEDALTEQTVALWFIRTVVDGLRLGYLSERVLEDFLR